MMIRHGFRTGSQLVGRRCFATSPPPTTKQGSSSVLLWTSLAIAGAGGAYYYFSSSNSPTVKANATSTTEKAKEALSSVSTGRSSGGTPTFTDPNQWVELLLKSRDSHTHNTDIFRFALPSPDHISGLHVASALLTQTTPHSSDEKPITRPYTPISVPDEKGYLDLLVKRYDGGPMSTYIHNMAPGQRLMFRGPLPKYPWTPNKHDHIALLAGGTGITPMYQLIQEIFTNPEDNTKVTLVFGNTSVEDVLLRNELAKYENDFPNRFKVFHVTSGFVQKELLEQVLPDPKSGNVKVFVCGPPAFYNAMSGPKKSVKEQGELKGYLKDLNWTAEQTYKF